MASTSGRSPDKRPCRRDATCWNRAGPITDVRKPRPAITVRLDGPSARTGRTPGDRMRRRRGARTARDPVATRPLDDRGRGRTLPQGPPQPGPFGIPLSSPDAPLVRSIPLSPQPHPLSVSLPETLAAGLPVALVLARLADRFPRPAVGPLQTLLAAILAAPLVRTVLQGPDDHFRLPAALYRTRTAAPPTDHAEDPPVEGIGWRLVGHDCPG